MRSLKDIWPEYADTVDFYAINVDPSDSLEDLENFGKNQGYPWPMADSDSEVLFKLHVTNQSTKVAFGADGIIVYREKMGGGGPDIWRGIFEELSSGA